MTQWWRIVAGAALCAGAATAQTRELVVNNSLSEPDAIRAVEAMVAAFEAEHPEIEVQLNTIEQEAYKTAIRNWLTTVAPDVIFWAAGERLRTFVELGLIEDVSDVWEAEGLAGPLAATRSAVSTDGAQYAVPFSTVVWGLYLREDVLEEAGIEPPETFDHLVAACATLRERGVTPIALGTKAPWTTAAWFDYINMRTNGLDLHLDVLAGEVPFTDPSLDPVFDRWVELLEADCFLENHPAYTFQEAMPPLINGQAAMTLIGSFVNGSFPEAVRGEIAFLPFPTIDPEMPLYEDQPLSTVAIPARAENKEDARAFLAFVARPDVQTTLNEAMARIPVHADATVSDDPLAQAGFALATSAEGVSQFFDRDSDPEMAQTAMEGFQRFMVRLEEEDAIRAELDRAQERIRARQGQ